MSLWCRSTCVARALNDSNRASHCSSRFHWVTRPRQPATAILMSWRQMTGRNSLTNQGQRMVHSSIYCNWFSCHLGWDVGFDHWSSGTFYGGCGQHNPLIGRRIECSFVLFFALEYISGKIPCLATGAVLLSFSLFLRSVLKFHCEGTSLMRNFDLYFSKRCPLFSRIHAWRSVDRVNRTRRIDPNTFCIGFPRDSVPLWDSNDYESC